MRKLIGLTLVAALAATLAATAVASNSPSNSTQRPVKHVRVGDYFFSRKHLTINKGTKVVWRFVGAVAHNVKVVTGPFKFSSHKQITGTFSHVFRKKGTWFLHCSIHPVMTETIVVQ